MRPPSHYLKLRNGVKRKQTQDSSCAPLSDIKNIMQNFLLLLILLQSSLSQTILVWDLLTLFYRFFYYFSCCHFPERPERGSSLVFERFALNSKIHGIKVFSVLSIIYCFEKVINPLNERILLLDVFFQINLPVQ